MAAGMNQLHDSDVVQLDKKNWKKNMYTFIFFINILFFGNFLMVRGS